jgi:hypothetical protein
MSPNRLVAWFTGSAVSGRRVLLHNAQVTSPVTEQVRALARKSGVPVVPVTETMPPAYRSCQAWQLPGRGTSRDIPRSG